MLAAPSMHPHEDMGARPLRTRPGLSADHHDSVLVKILDHIVGVWDCRTAEAFWGL